MLQWSLSGSQLRPSRRAQEERAALAGREPELAERAQALEPALQATGAGLVEQRPGLVAVRLAARHRLLAAQPAAAAEPTI